MKCLLIFLVFFCGIVCYGQQASYLHGHGDDDRAYSVALNGKNGYILAGSERATVDSSERIVVLNVSSKGTTIWKTVIDHPNHEVAEHIEATSDGGFIVVGTKWDLGFGRSDMYALKLNKDGEVEWDRYFGGNHRDEGFSVKETNDNGFVFAGFSKSDLGVGDFGQMYVVKTNHLGLIEWEQKLGASGKDYAFDVIQTSSNDFVVTGTKSGFHGYSTFDFSHTDSDIYVARLNENGTLIWIYDFGGSGNELAYQAVEMQDASISVIGSTQSQGAGSFDMYLLQIDAQGNEIASATFGDTGFDYGRSIDRRQNDLFIAGSVNLDTNTTDVRVIKTDLVGNEIWTYDFGGSDSEYAYEVRALDNGGCIVVGSTRSVGNGGEDMFLLRLNGDGKLESFTNPFGGEINVYPNPTSELVNFEINNGSECLSYRYEIIDQMGKIVFNKEKQVALFTLDVSGFAKGLFTLRVTSLCDGSEYHRKFVTH